MNNGNSVLGLVRELKSEAKMFIREEIKLAKTEMSEKISSFGGNAAAVGIGGFVAYAGLIVFLFGLGALLAFVFNRIGISPLLSAFIGLGLIGLTVIAAGGLMLMKGLKGFKKESLAPTRTIETLQHLKGNQGREPGRPAQKPEDKRSSEEIEAAVLEIEDRIAETLEKLTDRVTLGGVQRRVTLKVRENPYRWGIVAAGCGAAGSYILKKKLFK